MFEIQVDTLNDNQIVRAFVKSMHIQAFPCGRRRSNTLIENDDAGEASGAAKSFRIPFDPEARLNTEANNRKHSSLNGYTQTYLNHWKNGELSIVLAGYLFNITLTANQNSDTEKDYLEPDGFGTNIIRELSSRVENKKETITDTALKEALENVLSSIQNAEYIYANILVEDTKLFQGFKDYYTGILHDQLKLADNENEPALDILRSKTDSEELVDLQDPNNYYFSGLSFSTNPLAEIQANQQETWVSLCILKKEGETWRIYEPARLPKIEHGDTEDSVKIEHLSLDSLTIKKVDSNVDIEASGNIKLTGNNSTISADELKQNGYAVPTIELLDKESDKPQLKITLGPVIESN